MALAEYIENSIILDEAQKDILSQIEPIARQLSEGNFLAKFFASKKHDGLYIYGPVGRGKTIISKAFFDSIKTDKKIFYHYQTFLKYLHQESHKYFKKGTKDYVMALALKLSKTYNLIVIDELEIRDITDAMLIKRVTEILTKKNVFIVFTSNTNPKDLYLNGLQRELFLPFIKKIEEGFMVLHLNNAIDYRFLNIADHKQIILEGKSYENDTSFEEILFAFTKGHKFQEGTIELFGRNVKFANSSENILFASLEEIIDRELSYNDFIVIAEKYDLIILKATEKLPDDSDQIIRFINFIDNIYAAKLLLVAYFGKNIAQICSSQKYSQMFNRTISRLAEMQSQDYIKKSKYYGKNHV